MWTPLASSGGVQTSVRESFWTLVALRKGLLSGTVETKEALKTLAGLKRFHSVHLPTAVPHWVGFNPISIPPIQPIKIPQSIVALFLSSNSISVF